VFTCDGANLYRATPNTCEKYIYLQIFS